MLRLLHLYKIMEGPDLARIVLAAKLLKQVHKHAQSREGLRKKVYIYIISYYHLIINDIC